VSETTLHFSYEVPATLLLSAAVSHEHCHMACSEHRDTMQVRGTAGCGCLGRLIRCKPVSSSLCVGLTATGRRPEVSWALQPTWTNCCYRPCPATTKPRQSVFRVSLPLKQNR